MSEFNPFSAQEEAPESAAEESEGSADSRKNLIALGALGAVALGAGAFFFLGGSGEEEFEAFVPAARAPGAAAPAPSASPAAKLPPATKLSLGRNPFRALYVQPAGGGGTTSGGSTGGTTTPPTSTGGTTTPIVLQPAEPLQPAPAQPAPGQPAPAPAQPAPAPAPAPAQQSTVSLKGVATGKDGSNPIATFVYDGKEVSGAPGDVMEGKLLVISIQQDNTGGWFANLQLGDGSPFEVHERQTVLVQ